jgi:hypothetical protein
MRAGSRVADGVAATSLSRRAFSEIVEFRKNRRTLRVGIEG